MQSGLELRHHLHPLTAGVYLSHGSDGLVQSVRALLGNLGHVGYQFLLGGIGSSLADRYTRDVQYGPGGAVHQCRVYQSAQSCRYSHQLGWQRASVRQHFCGEIMAQCQIRGGVHQRLPKRSRGGEQLACVLHLLQSRAIASGIRLSNARTGVYESIKQIFSNGCVLSYFRPKTVLTIGTTILTYFIATVIYAHITDFNDCTSDSFLKILGCDIQGASIFIAFPYYYITQSEGNFLLGLFVLPWLIYIGGFIIYLEIIYFFVYFVFPRFFKKLDKSKK